MEPIIISIVVTALATLLASKTYNSRKKKITNTLRKAPFKRIALIENGETVTIAGNIVFYKTSIVAPLSQRECVFYHATVEQMKSSGKSSSWSKEIDEVSSVHFILDDGDHYALVEANAVEGYLEMDKHYKSGTFNDATQIMESFLNKYKKKSTQVFGMNKKLRYKEGALEKHEYCIVCGTCYWEKGKDYDIEGHEDILVIKASKGQPIYLSDKKDILV